MKFPAGLYYTEDHEWIRVEDDQVAYIGITDFAQHELGELVYVEVDTVDETLAKGEIFGTIEAVKTTSDLYMPVSGTVEAFNERLEDSPDTINSDAYGEGWIVRIVMSDPKELKELMDPTTYQQQVETEDS